MPARQGWRLALGAALASAAAPAHAAWQCTDVFGNVYRFQDQRSDGSILKCVDDTLPAGNAAVVVRRQESVASVAPVAPVFVPARISVTPQRYGELVLAPGDGSRKMSRSAAALRATYDPLIEAVARSTNQDADLLRAIVQVESRFNPAAISPKGAIGLMQVMPSTAAGLGLADPRRALLEPESNLRIGAMYMRRLQDMFPGNPRLAIAAYNAGEGAVQKHGFNVPPYPETQGYVRDVLAIWGELRSRR